MHNTLWIIIRTGQEILFGSRHDYSRHIHRLLVRQGGVYHYQPFARTRIATLSLFPYRSAIIHDSIWQMKFKNQQHYCQLYGSLLGETLTELLSEIGPIYHFIDPIVVAVPSHVKTIRKRGYSVTDLLVRETVKRTPLNGLVYAPCLLSKVKHIPRQSMISNRKERLSNPKRAFVVTKPTLVKNKNIILVDDVYTTGATLNECTTILRQAGAKRVLRITLAH